MLIDQDLSQTDNLKMDLQISIIAENSSKFELEHGTNIQDYELDEAELFIAVNFSIGVRYIF